MAEPRLVLGIAASNHDRAAALLRDGKLVCAIGEERLDRRKRSSAYVPDQHDRHTMPPFRAITAVLREAGVGLDDLALVVCGRSLHAYRDALLSFLPLDPERVVEPTPPAHHLAHAYSAFGTAPYDTAAVLVLDEQGHWIGDSYESGSWLRGRPDGWVEPVRAFMGTRRRLSLGLFYSAVSAMVGLTEAGLPAAGKLMGLAATGDPPSWRRVVNVDSDGAPFVELDDLDELLDEIGLRHTPSRDAITLRSASDLPLRYRRLHWSNPLARSLAAYAQAELQRGVLATAGALRAAVDEQDLCLAGGVTLNGPSLTRLSEVGWRDAYVHPAATDDGIAVGLAFYGHHEVLGGERIRAAGGFNPYLGPTHLERDVTTALCRYALPDSRADADSAIAAAAADISAGAVVGWCHGRSEWGPRALGARSILAELGPGIAERINRDVKHREPFRPVGISVTARALKLLALDRLVPPGLAPYMIAVVPGDHDLLTHVRHTDGSIRVHVVDPNHNAAFHDLLRRVGALTGLEAVVNTSFNGLGEPLVESPADAVRQYLLLAIDALYVDGRFLRKRDLAPAELVAASRLAMRDTTVSGFGYARGLIDRGLHDQARNLLAAVRRPGETVLSGGQTLVAAELAAQAGFLGLARALCERHLAVREEPELAAFAEILSRCGDPRADHLSRLAAPGGVGAALTSSTVEQPSLFTGLTDRASA